MSGLSFDQASPDLINSILLIAPLRQTLTGVGEAFNERDYLRPIHVNEVLSVAVSIQIFLSFPPLDQQKTSASASE